MEYFAFIAGIAAVIIYLLGYQQKTRRRIIVFNTLSRMLYILQYLFLSALEGAVLDLGGIVSSMLAQKKDKKLVKKHLKIVVFSVNLLIIILGLSVYKNIFSLLPICGVVLHTSAFWITDEKTIRRISLFGCPFWLAYNLVSRAYGSMIGDVLSMVSLIIAIYRYDISQ